MIDTARRALIHVLGLEREDRVLVVTDEVTRTIGEAFRAAAYGQGCATSLYLLPEERRPLTEVPEELSLHLEDKTVVLTLFRAIADEIPFRVQLCLLISQTRRIRFGHSPGITEAMMVEGPMNVDYRAMREGADRLVQSFADAVLVHITAPAGTDLVLGIEGRAFRSDVGATVEVACNLPCGEVYCAPVETEADGLLVIDGSASDLGIPAAPLRFTLERGRITGLEGADRRLRAEVERRTTLDRDAGMIGELGIGVNPGAKLTGNMLEDEKAFRTAHVAFGNNEEMPGGRNRSKTHEDYLFYRPTLRVTYRDGTRRVLVEEGEIRV
jgi:leucyl aminopeptidase (aminopeptidase T)